MKIKILFTLSLIILMLSSCGEKRTLDFHNHGILEGVSLDFNWSKDEAISSQEDELAILIYNDKGLISKELIFQNCSLDAKKDIELEEGIYNILAFSNKTKNVKLTDIYNCNTPSLITSDNIEALISTQPSKIYSSYLKQIVINKDCNTKKEIKMERMSKKIDILVHFTDINSMYQCNATIFGFADGINLNDGNMQTERAINHKAILDFSEKSKSEGDKIAGTMTGTIQHFGFKKESTKKLYLDIYFKDSQKHYFINREFKEIDKVDGTKDLKVEISLNNSGEITFITKIDVWEEIDLGDIEAK